MFVMFAIRLVGRNVREHVKDATQIEARTVFEHSCKYHSVLCLATGGTDDQTYFNRGKPLQPPSFKGHKHSFITLFIKIGST